MNLDARGLALVWIGDVEDERHGSRDLRHSPCLIKYFQSTEVFGPPIIANFVHHRKIDGVDVISQTCLVAENIHLPTHPLMPYLLEDTVGRPIGPASPVASHLSVQPGHGILLVRIKGCHVISMNRANTRIEGFSGVGPPEILNYSFYLIV